MGSQAICPKGFFPFVHLNDWLYCELSHRGSQSRNHELRWEVVKFLLCARHLHTVSLNHVKSPPRSADSTFLVLQMNIAERSHGQKGTAQVGWVLSPDPDPLHFLSPLRWGGMSQLQRRRQMEWLGRAGEEDGGAAAQSHWFDPDGNTGMVGGQRVCLGTETSRNWTACGRSRPSFHHIQKAGDQAKGLPFPPASVHDSHALLYVKMQLAFCSGLISLNNWDPECLSRSCKFRKGL